MTDANLQFVQQPTPNTCVHACLAMVTGVPVGDLVERFGDRGLPLECELAVLVEHGIFPDMRYYSAPALLPGLYLATAPSLNNPGGLHRIVVEVTHENDFVIYDPNTGREGVGAYPPNAMHGGEPGIYITETLRLDTDMLKHMRQPDGEGK